MSGEIVAGNKEHMSTMKEEARNCVENLLVLEEISVDKYEVLMEVIDLFDISGIIRIGDEFTIELVDNKK